MSDLLLLTADDLDGPLEDRVRHHPGPIGVAALDTWATDDVEAMRYRLSFFDLRRPARVDEHAVSLDGLIDALVGSIAAINPERSVVRLHHPTEWDDAERARVQSCMDPDDSPLFYVDREARVFDSGLLYDAYEVFIWVDE